MAKTTKKKTAKKKGRRKMTAAEKKAFANRMKRARAAKAKGKTTKKKTRRKTSAKKSTAKKTVRKTTRRKSVKRKKEVAPMAKRRSRKKSSGSKKRSSRRRGGGGLFKGGNVMNSIKEAAIAVGGGIVAGMVANKVPIPNPILKASSPAILGAALLATVGKKNKIVGQMATGMMVLGGVAAIRAAFPNVPLLAGEEEIMVTPDMLGYDGDDGYDYTDDMPMSGPVDLGVNDISDMLGENEMFLTSANM